MKLKYLLTLMVLFCGISLAQQYPLVTIQDIQQVPDSLKGTDPASPLNGDTVRVQGMVMVRPVVDPVTDRGVVISAGARWVTYVQDPEGKVWGGMNILQEDTTKQGTFFDLIDTAQVVEFTGVVTEYYTTTEMILTSDPVQIISSEAKRQDPIQIQLSDLFTSDGGYNFDAEKYENMYVSFENVISSDRAPGGSSVFKINDGNGHSAFIYSQSRYFKSGSAGINDYQPPQDGSFLSYVRGILTTRTDGYYLVPLYPEDVGPAVASPPVISSIRRDITEVTPTSPVTISAKVKDLDGSVNEVNLNYSVNGAAYQTLAMTSADSIYSATVPAANLDSAIVDFYITASDNDNNVSSSDTAKTRYFYMVLNRPVTIQDVQYSPFGGGYSAYNGYYVTVSGVITSDADTTGNPNLGQSPIRINMQNGSGPWSGIWIGTSGFNGTEVIKLKRGQQVNITGLVQENYNVTRLDSVQTIDVVSSGNALPEAELLQTGDIDYIGTDAVPAEQWESVLIKYQDVTVVDENADGSPGPDVVGGSRNFGEIVIDDNSGPTRVELQEGYHLYHNDWDNNLFDAANNHYVKDSSTFKELKGILYYSHGYYKLVPRTNDDFVGFSITDVQKENNSLPTAFALNQNYPNPFNPTTTITYAIPSDGIVTLKIFNILGQAVKTLVNQYQSTGNYKVSFDAGTLNSGVYLYQLNVNGHSQVKKMMLLK